MDAIAFPHVHATYTFTYEWMWFGGNLKEILCLQVYTIAIFCDSYCNRQIDKCVWGGGVM